MKDQMNSADYQLGAVFGAIVLMALVLAAGILLLLKLARRSPEYHIRRARQAALRQSRPNDDPF